MAKQERTEALKTARIKAEAEAQVKAEMEAEEKAEEVKADAELDAVKLSAAEESQRIADEADEKLSDEARGLGIKPSRIRMSSFKSKDPEKIDKEQAKHDKMVNKRIKKRIAKKKAEVKLKPIDKRKALLVGRFKAVKSRNRPNSYSDANLKAWLEELNMIKNSPGTWNKLTKNGTIGFVPGNKKKKTARDEIDGMDLDD